MPIDSDAIQPSHPLSSPSPPACSLSQQQGLFQWVNSASGDQSIGASASASVLPMNTQDWSPLGWTGWISLQSKGVSRVFSSTTVQKQQSFFFSFIFISWRLITLQYCSGLCHTLTWISHGFTCIPHPDPPSHLFLYPVPLSLPSAPTILWRSAFFIIQLSHPYITTGKTIALTRWAFVGKIMSLLFNTLSWLVITFLPRRQCLLISWLQSPSTVILEPQKSKALDLSEIVLKSGLPSWNSVTHRCY